MRQIDYENLIPCGATTSLTLTVSPPPPRSFPMAIQYGNNMSGEGIVIIRQKEWEGFLLFNGLTQTPIHDLP